MQTISVRCRLTCVAELSGSALELMASWMRQHGDLPMDLADASQLWVVQEHGLRSIASLENLLDA